MVKVKYTCRYCGFTSDTLDDFEEDLQHHQGYWCPDCDSFTYYEEKQDSRAYTVLLENKDKKESTIVHPRFQLKKQASPLRYPGGKSKALDLISSYLSEEKKTFVDVYCGGGSVGLSLLLSGVIEHLVMNDLDKGVYAFFHTILTNPEPLLEKVRTVIPDRELFFHYQQMIKDNYEGFSEEERAFGFLVVNRLAFSGIWNASPVSDVLQRWNPKTLESKILAIWERRESIEIKNEDALGLIEESFWNKNATVFVDPPYYIAESKKLYHHVYGENEHRELAFLLNSLASGMPACADILVTYDNHPFIEELYGDGVAEIKEVFRRYSIAKAAG